MNKSEYNDTINGIMDTVLMHDDLNLIKAFTPVSESESVISKVFGKNGYEDDGLFTLYSLYDGVEFKWNQENQENTISGSIYFIQLNQMKSTGKGLIFFDHTDKNSPLRNFKILDFFSDEACVGFYFSLPKYEGLHYFEFENEAFPLYINFDSYLTLLKQTRGFWYWPKVLVEHNENTPGPVTNHFKSEMPKIFPDFDFDKFIETYESLKFSE